MPEKIYFAKEDDGSVSMQSRAEGGGGTVGDARSTIRKGDVIIDPKGLTYEALVKAGGGVIKVADDGSYEIKTGA